jgi:hypothetical protein
LYQGSASAMAMRINQIPGARPQGAAARAEFPYRAKARFKTVRL